MTKQSAFCGTIVVLAAVAAVAMGLSGCGGSGSGSSTPPPPTPDFTLTALSGAVSVAQGASGSSTVTAAVSGGFSAPIALTASGQPTGVTIGFSQATIPAPGSGSSSVTIAVGAAVATGNYTITITGTGSGITHTATVALTVTGPPPPPPDFTLTVPSTAVSIAQGASGTSTATTTVSNGFSAPIALTASGLPASVYIGFSQATLAAPGSGTSTLTIAVGPAVAAGNYSITVTGVGGSVTHTATVALTVTSATAPPGTPLLVGYLPDYQGSYATFATSLDFNKMTHLVLAFGLPPSCGGTCTASSNMTWALNQTDADIATLVSAAHAAGVKVLLSIGGGDQASDALIEQFYDVGLSTPLVAALDSYLTTHNLDGVDVDMEDPANMGTNYDTFATTLITKMHSEGKVASTTAATWIWESPPYPDSYGAPMANSTLQAYDIVGVMAYSFLGYDTTAAQYYSDTVMSMQYFGNLGVPNSKMTVGVPFYAQNASGSISETYATIVGAYPDASQTNEVSGGSLDGGATIYYMGDALMAQETQLGAEKYGGVMIWELSQDAPTPDSLLTVIQNNL
jgi:chitinase